MANQETPLSSRLLQSKPSKRFRRGSPYVVEMSGDGGSLDDAVKLLIEDSQVPAHLKTILGHLLEKANLTEELPSKNRELEAKLQFELAEKKRLLSEIDRLKEALSKKDEASLSSATKLADKL
ncbi:unnamed protein product [Nippostrongylus brasiliensis]|uniref:Mediator of RNA polymerase II transcription subunit 9 n=1 Tax=Nippostrongylus brasiliensis TaxID=27835 RepID=A0A0N4YDS6_NIPBR|nr:unnamed protein product [Nippostrongylus brasiliensis]